MEEEKRAKSPPTIKIKMKRSSQRRRRVARTHKYLRKGLINNVKTMNKGDKAARPRLDNRKGWTCGCGQAIRHDGESLGPCEWANTAVHISTGRQHGKHEPKLLLNTIFIVTLPAQKQYRNHNLKNLLKEMWTLFMSGIYKLYKIECQPSVLASRK